MSQLQQRLQHLAYTVPFTNKIELDEFDFNDIRSALHASTVTILDASQNLTNIEMHTDEIAEQSKDAQAKIKAAIELARINNLPKHFVEAFTHLLNGVSDHVDTIQQTKVPDLIANVIEELDNADLYEE